MKPPIIFRNRPILAGMAVRPGCHFSAALSNQVCPSCAFLPPLLLTHPSLYLGIIVLGVKFDQLWPVALGPVWSLFFSLWYMLKNNNKKTNKPRNTNKRVLVSKAVTGCGDVSLIALYVIGPFFPLSIIILHSWALRYFINMCGLFSTFGVAGSDDPYKESG